MKRSELAFLILLVPVDYLGFVLASVASYYLRYQPSITEIRPVIFDLSLPAFIGVASVAGVAAVTIFAVSGMYRQGQKMSSWTQFRRLFLGMSTLALLVTSYMFFSRELFSSRFIVLATWLLAIVIIYILRLVCSVGQRLLYRQGIGVRRAVIIGNTQAATALTEHYATHPGLGVRVVAQYAEFDSHTQNGVSRLAADDAVDEIIQTRLDLNQDARNNLITFSYDHHLDLKYVANLFDTHHHNLHMIDVAGLPMVEVKKTPLDGWGRVYKRGFDCVAASVIIVVLSPILLIIALGIKWSSPGPILFHYERIGKGGRRFRYFKFRSMVHNAHLLRYDETWQADQANLRPDSPLYKFAHDPRVTRFGQMLRRWSLDELPELFLVLKGAMSLVGPRPHEPEEVAQYQHHHRRVLTIAPGMTGLAQVSGRSDLTFEDEVRLDTYYMERWSPLFDLFILFKTPIAVFRRRQTE